MSLQQSGSGPQLSPDGESLLRDVLERREQQTRWDRDATAPEPAPTEPDAQPHRQWALPVAAGLAAVILLVGLTLGVSAWEGRTQPVEVADQPASTTTGLDPIQPSVAGAIETREPDSNADTPAVAADASAAEPAIETSDPAESLVDAAAAPQVETAPVDTVAALVQEPGAVDIQAYARPAEGERLITTFALRIRQDDGAVLATDQFEVIVETDGVAQTARLRFEQTELPAASSAIATVRLDTPVPSGAVLTLLWDGTVLQTTVLGSDDG